MARKPKTRTVEDLVEIQRALLNLARAVEGLRIARAPQAAKYVRRAMKSAQGAERHCKGHMLPFDRQVAVKAGIY